ncbi:MAG: peptidyl-prolyl cis-trans isomerase [Candidatus Poribacteria bacterium]|nr:peptidyl-prolyl cis-trans isomerase [Candidatus Poribacteria bacterium]
MKSQMSGFASFILIGIVATCIVFNGCGGSATAAEGTVIAEFEWDGKHQITLEEMMEEIGELPDYKQRKYKDKSGLEEYMTLMAESRLILCLAKDQKLDEDEEILKKVKDHLHKLMVDKITETEVEEKLVLTEEDYRLYYETNTEDYIDTEHVELTCIALGDEERAAEVLEELKGGRDMIELATELSDRDELVGPGADDQNPGKTGKIRRGAFPEGTEPFVDAAFAAEVGELHDSVIKITVRGKSYFIVFRKDIHNEERQKTFDEEGVRRNVERAAKRQKRKELMAQWLGQLRDRANVQIHSELIPDAPEEEEEEVNEGDAVESEETEQEPGESMEPKEESAMPE